MALLPVMLLLLLCGTVGPAHGVPNPTAAATNALLAAKLVHRHKHRRRGEVQWRGEPISAPAAAADPEAPPPAAAGISASVLVFRAGENAEFPCFRVPAL